MDVNAKFVHESVLRVSMPIFLSIFDTSGLADERCEPVYYHT